MKNIKLQAGDNIRIIAPARSLSLLSDETIDIATKNIESIGLKVSFGKNVKEIDEYQSSTINSRLLDLHDAFEDKTVKGILTVIGGFNSNQLLNKINYSLIKANPKPLCGFSDITALSNAIYTKTGLITYYGPHFSTFGMKLGIDYTIEYFKKCLMSEEPFTISSSKEWSDDEWFRDQNKRMFIKNSGTQIINNGSAKGVLIGGNLCTFNLLQGTDFMPNIRNKILILEEDNMLGSSTIIEFDRNIQSIIDLKGFNKVKGILIGRFQKESKISNDQLFKLLKSKIELKHIPIISNVDFGHTTPQITLPIGGIIELNTKNTENPIKIIVH